MLKRSVIVAGVLAIGFVLGFGTLAFTQDKKPAVPATRAGLYRIHAATKSLEDAERHLQRSEHHFGGHRNEDWKSTRLNSSHRCISYAVFCLKKKKNTSQSE